MQELAIQNPHYRMLAALYKLYATYSDPIIREQVSIIAYTLWQDLDFPDYFDLYELSLNMDDDLESNKYYHDEIKAQLAFFAKEQQAFDQGVKTAYEREKAEFPQFLLQVSYESRSGEHGLAARIFCKAGSYKIETPSTELKKATQSILRQFKEAHECKETLIDIFAALPGQVGEFRKFSYDIISKHDVYPETPAGE